MKLVLAFATVASLSSCGSSKAPPPVAPPVPPPAESTTVVLPAPQPAQVPATKSASLYDRLGGRDAIVAVVDDFVGRTTTDPRIMYRFFNTDAANLKRLLVELVCQTAGGPCKYSGRTMESTHAGMDLVGEEFDALVEDLVATLDKFKVPAREKGELLGALGPLKPTMVVASSTLSPIADAKLLPVTAIAAKTTDAEGARLLAAAITAGRRGQRSYAEQLFSRAEIVLGIKAVASVAGVFREGAPPRITTALKKAPADAAPQPARVGGSEADAPDAKPGRGSLQGTLTIGGKPVTGLGVIMLTPVKGGRKRVAKTRVIEQREKQFAPHVLAVPVGSTVQFPNYDNIYHNVFSLSKGKAFDLGLYKNGEFRDIVFTKPGVVRLGCNIHASMSAYVIVVDAPHYVITDDAGSFAFRSLAPGKYKMRAWSERSGAPLNADVEIKAGPNTREVDLQAVEAAPTDKFGAPLRTD